MQEQNGVNDNKRTEIDPGNLLHGRLRSRNVVQPTDDDLEHDHEDSAFPPRKPRVDDERYQAKLPELITKPPGKDNPKLSQRVLWNGYNTLQKEEVDEFMVFCRRLTNQDRDFTEEDDGSANVLEGIVPLESDEQCLGFLHSCNYDIVQAKFKLLSQLGIGTEATRTHLYYNIVDELGRKKVRPEKVNLDSGSETKAKASNGGSSESPTKRFNWKKWMHRAKAACAGKPAPTRDTLFQLHNEIAAVDHVPESASNAYITIQKKLEQVDEWVAQAHDALSMVKPDGHWRVQELKTLLNKAPTAVKIAEEKVLRKVYGEWCDLESELEHAIDPSTRGLDLDDLRTLLNKVENVPIDFAPQKSSLIKRIETAQGFIDQICKVLPKTKTWRSSFTRKFWTMQTREYLRELSGAVSECGVLFPEATMLRDVLGEADDWLKAAKRALGKGAHVRELVSLLKKADSIPVDLTSEKQQFDEQVKLAQDWLKKVKGAVPKMGKTRVGSSVKKMDLESLRMFRDEASTLGMDLAEADNINQVVQSAEDWKLRVDQALSASDSVELDQLKLLLGEGEQLPVLMESDVKLLQVEVSGREWVLQLHKAFEEKPLLSVFEAMLDEFLQLRKELPGRGQHGWKSEPLRMLREVLTTAKDWQKKAGVLIGPEAKKQRASLQEERRKALGSRFGLAELDALIAAASNVRVDLTAEVELLQALKLKVETSRARIRAFLAITSQQGLSGGSTSEVDLSDLVIEGKNKCTLPRLEEEIATLNADGVMTEELDLLQQALDKAKEWLELHHEVFEVQAVEGSRKRKLSSTESNPITTHYVKSLILSARDIIVDMESETQQLAKAIATAEQLQSQAKLKLVEYKQLLQTTTVEAPATAMETETDTTVAPDVEKVNGEKKEETKEEAKVEVAEPEASVENKMDISEDESESLLVRLGLTLTKNEVETFDTFDNKLESKYGSHEKSPTWEQLSNLADYSIENGDVEYKLQQQEVEGCNSQLEEVITTIEAYVRQVKKSEVFRLMNEMSEFRECLWIVQAKQWCIRVQDYVTHVRAPRLSDLKVFVVEGCQLTLPSAHSPLQPSSAELHELDHNLLHSYSDKNTDTVRSSKRARTASTNTGDELDAEAVELVNAGSSASACVVEGVDYIKYSGLGMSVLRRLRILQQWTRLGFRWVSIAKSTMQTNHKTKVYALVLRDVLLLKMQLKLNVSLEEEKLIRAELKKTKNWIERAQAVLQGVPKLHTSEQVEQLVGEGYKLKTWAFELKQMKSMLKQGKEWLSQVKKSGIERGEASVEALQALIEESKRIKLDLSKHTSVLQQATKQYCLCRAPYDGLMIGCDSCDEWYHAGCVNISQKNAKKIQSYTCPCCVLGRMIKVQKAVGQAIIIRVSMKVATAPGQDPTLEKFLEWLKHCFASGFTSTDKDIVLKDCQLNDCWDSYNMLALVTDAQWCRRLFKAFKRKVTLTDLEEFLKTCPKSKDSLRSVQELLENLVTRGKAWTARAQAVLNCPLDEPTKKILTECKSLLALSPNLPIDLKEEKLLAACVEDSAARYCICRKFNDGGFMIGCDRCEDWFHGACVNLSQKVGDTLTSWTCPQCLEKDKPKEAPPVVPVAAATPTETPVPTEAAPAPGVVSSDITAAPEPAPAPTPVPAAAEVVTNGIVDEATKPTTDAVVTEKQVVKEKKEEVPEPAPVPSVGFEEYPEAHERDAEAMEVDNTKL